MRPSSISGNVSRKTQGRKKACHSLSAPDSKMGHHSPIRKTAPIIGATKVEHVEDAVNEIELKLSNDDVKRLMNHTSHTG